MIANVITCAHKNDAEPVKFTSPDKYTNERNDGDTRPATMSADNLGSYFDVTLSAE